MAGYFQQVIIDEIRDETPDAYSLVFRAGAGTETLPSYLPGQYLTLRIYVDGMEYRRAYSICTSPFNSEAMAVTIKRVEGGILSNYIRDNMIPGDAIDVLPPMGNFIIEPDVTHVRHYIFFGAGSGITPLMSMIQSVLSEEPESIISLWYGNRHESGIIFYDQLNQLQGLYPDRLSIYHTLSQPSGDWAGRIGRITQELVYDWILDLFMRDEYKKRYFLCGPAGMIAAVENALAEHAVHPKDVFKEFFSAPVPTEEEVANQYADPSEEETGPKTYSDGENTYELMEQEVEVVIGGNSNTLVVSPDESILGSAIKAGLDPPYTCLSGICTTCKAMVHAGIVAMDESEGLSEKDMEEGYVLSCQAHPLTDDVKIEFESLG